MFSVISHTFHNGVFWKAASMVAGEEEEAAVVGPQHYPSASPFSSCFFIRIGQGKKNGHAVGPCEISDPVLNLLAVIRVFIA